MGTHNQHQLMTLRRRRIRNIVLNTLTIVIAALVIVWAGYHFWRYQTNEITNDAVVDQYIAPINSRVSGYIEKVCFTEHQKVCRGDTLIVLDKSEFVIKQMDAEAALQEAMASADATRSSINTSKSNIAVSESNIAETKARLSSKEQEYKRAQILLASESISVQENERVKAEYEATLAHYQSLMRQRESSTLLTTEIGKKATSADALILRRRADVEMARLNLSYTVITAPYDGYMGRRSLEVGQLVQAGQTLSNLVRGDSKWVTANYKETQIANIYIGQSVVVRVDAFKNQIFRGRVSAISEATGAKYSLLPTDNSAGNFVKIQQRIPVRIEFEDVSPEQMQQLRTGMMVEAEAKIRR